MTDRIIYLRGVPDELHHKISVAAATNRRTLPQEVVARLSASFEAHEPEPASGHRTEPLTRKEPT